MDALGLPIGWSLSTIPELVASDGVFIDGDWVETKDQNPEGEMRLIQLADVGDGIYRDRSSRFLTNVKASELGCTFLETGDVLIARMPDPLGRACIFPGDRKRCVTVVDVCIVRTGSSGVDHRWLMHALNAPGSRSAIAALQSGSTRKRISRSNLATIEFPLPPLPEQHRIVEKIEELFSDLDAGVEALKKVKAELKRYRQAVLKAAVEGKLTKEWRENNRVKLEPASVLLERIRAEREKNGKAKKLPQIDTSKLPRLPGGWEWTRLENLAANEPHSITDGPFGSKLKTSHYTESGPRVIRLQNIGDGFFKDEKAHISREHFETLRRHEVYCGDIVIAGLGEGLPRSCVIPKGVGLAIVKADCIRFKVNNEITDASFLNIALNSDPLKKIATDIIHGVGRPRLNQRQIKSLLIPFPPPAEQFQIISEVDHRLSAADEVEKTIDTGLREAERLRQSILKRAFEGKLVPQDPSDPPASELLEKIKIAREQKSGRDDRPRKKQQKRKQA